MSRLGPTGLVQLLTDIKNWVLSKISAGTAAKARGLPTGTVNESSSTATLTITLDDITELYAGLAICIRMPFANAASSTLNVNNLGAKPIYYLNNTTSASRIPANTYVILIYDTITADTGCWKLVYSLDTNDNNATAQNISTANNTYPVLIGYTANATANIGNKATLFGKDIKVNPSTGALYATKLYSGGTEVLTSHQSLSSYATKSYVDTSVANLVNSAPEALDTLNELATALGNDANFSTTMTNLIGAKADDTSVVHTSGNEIIAGTKTFNSTITGSISGNAATATKATGNANGKELTNTIIKGLSISGKTITYTQIDGTTGTLTTQDTNTDTLMTQNVSTTNATYPILLCATADATANQGAKTGIFGSGVKVNPSTSTITATTFSGALTGNVTGNVSGSSGSCTGNAATATQFSANTTVALTGDATGTSAGSKKGWSVPVTLANSGVTAGSYGPSAAASPAHGGTFSVPYVTVDAKGRVTAASTITITLPADSNTDTLMAQNVSTTNATYPVLLCPTANATSNQGAKTGIFAKSVKINPSTNVISASGFSGPLTGNVTGNCSGSSGSCTGNSATATKATQDGSGNVITTTYATITDTAEMTAAEVSTVTAQVLT